MFAPGQAQQHRLRLGLIPRFAENPPVEHHGGVGAQHARRGGGLFAAQRGVTRLGLAARQALDIGRRGFVCQRGFIDVRADGGEWHADLRQQLTPAWRT
ncbi:hypothetical protein D3C81_1628840 [compost metagenome]